MIIDCIADLHGHMPELPGGDMLIIAGDLTARDTEKQHTQCYRWMRDQPYKHKILVAGNHDGYIYALYTSDSFGMSTVLKRAGVNFLCDCGMQIEGLKIWGSPWTPEFYKWHFMKKRGEDIKKMWDMIPDDVDILITHGPAYGIQDQVCTTGESEGCQDLRHAIDNRLTNLKLHVFGHVHEAYGEVMIEGRRHVNCSIMNEKYQPVNKPIRIIL